MRMIAITLCLFLFSVAGCSTISTPASSPTQINVIDEGKPALSLSQKEKWTQLVGKWFGNQPTKSEGRIMWIAERHNDGMYRIHFRVIDASGKKVDKTELGEWGVSGSVYFTIYKGDVEGDKIVPVDPTDPYNRDAYKILKLDNEIFEYESFDPVNKYTVRRVPSDFKFPE